MVNMNAFTFEQHVCTDLLATFMFVVLCFSPTQFCWPIAVAKARGFFTFDLLFVQARWMAACWPSSF